MKNFQEFLNYTPEEILSELTLPLRDAGLFVKISRENERFSDSKTKYLFVEILDSNKIYCKKYPIDDLDWLCNKPIILEFLKDIEYFGLIRGVHFKMYGGGLSTTLKFNSKGIEKIHL